MSPNVQRKVRFINISNPAASASANVQRRAHSHAAREAHARTRRLRTAEHVLRNDMKLAHAGRGHEEAGVVRRDSKRDIWTPCVATSRDTQAAGTCSPVSVLSSNRRDPFASLAMSLGRQEHFLLDHCK
jgi:hypothetical protein